VPTSPPDGSDPARLERIRSALVSAGYESSAIAKVLPARILGTFQRGWSGPARRKTDEKTPLHTLLRLFVLGMEVPEKALEEVAEANTADWVRTGLVRIRRGTAKPLVRLHPGRVADKHLFIASDDVPPNALVGVPDFVFDSDRTSAQLASATLRRPFGRALDVGTGNGVQAVFAAQHCEEVVATDVNPRALAFAEFNLALNGVTNVELRQGDLYQPVAGETFDLIVSNPPFVVSPWFEYLHRDSRLPLDEISATVVREAGQRLRFGGWAEFNCLWVERSGEPWEERVKSWCATSGCNVAVLPLIRQDPVTYAIEYVWDVGQIDAELADKRFAELVTYLEEQQVTRVIQGFVILQKTDSDDPWFLTEELSAELTTAQADGIAELFEAQEWLVRRPSAESLLAERFRIPDSVHVEPTLRSEDGHWVDAGVTLHKVGGIHSSIHILDPAGRVVSSCTGERPLQELIDVALQRHGVAISPIDSRYRSLITDFEALVLRLVRTGFLQPA